MLYFTGSSSYHSSKWNLTELLYVREGRKSGEKPSKLGDRQQQTSPMIPSKNNNDIIIKPVEYISTYLIIIIFFFVICFICIIGEEHCTTAMWDSFDRPLTTFCQLSDGFTFKWVIPKCTCMTGGVVSSVFVFWQLSSLLPGYDNVIC